MYMNPIRLSAPRGIDLGSEKDPLVQKTNGRTAASELSRFSDVQASGRQQLPPWQLLESRRAAVMNPGGSPFAMLAQSLAYCIHQFFGEQPRIKGNIPLTLQGHKDPVHVNPEILGRIPDYFSADDVQGLINNVQEKIDSGAELLGHVLSDNRDPVRNPATEKEVADVMWFLQVKAQAKVGEFSDGSMTISDPGNRIRNFLDSCPAYYQRLSSHIEEFQQSDAGQHRGIDLYGGASNPDHLLPHRKETVLYGALNPKDGLHMPDQRLWLKLESHGCYFSRPEIGPDKSAPPERSWNMDDVSALAGHGLGAVCSKVLGWLGLNSPSGTRKERIPPPMKNAYNRIVDAAPDHIKAVLTADNPTGNAQGLRVMLGSIAAARNSDETADIALKLPWQVEADEFEDLYLNSNDVRYDHPELRFGEEVILVTEDVTATEFKFDKRGGNVLKEI